jgi:GNAT superfamily N-acetyltransferase
MMARARPPVTGGREPTRPTRARRPERIRGAPGRRAGLVIRPATARDVSTIVKLIRGLADYERLAHEVRISAARVRRHGFGRHRYFDTLLCERHGAPIGFALYFFTYSTFLARPTLYLEDLFVLPAERGSGAGRALLKALARMAVARGCGRMEWTVLDWNEPAIRFYEQLGAQLRRDWILTRLTGEPLRALASGR